MKALRYLSVCSGIEAATVAWSPLGWQAVAVAEIEPFPSSVLACHYPHVPNVGDMTTINGADFKGQIDVLVGGTPCQSFSVAGLRGGLNDARGNLALEYVRIADESDPAFVVWENVPGVLSDRGNAFGCFLAALAGEDAPLLPPGGRWANAGYVLGPRRAIAWRILDAQFVGLAQRRRRVFVIGCPRNGSDPRTILFEFDGLRRDFAPGRAARQDVAGTLDASFGRSRGAGTPAGAITSHWEGGPHPSLSQSHNTGGIGMSNQELFSQHGGGLVGSLTSMRGGPDDNKAQAVFYVADVVPTLRAGGNATGGDRPIGMDVDTCESLVGYAPEVVSQAISCKWSKGTSGPAGDEHHNLVAQEVALAFAQNQLGEVRTGEVIGTLNQNTNASGRNTAMAYTGSAVRRLTPRECERLQGFPDDYTLIPYRGKAAADCADGPRYKALGNSMAVPVMRWIAARIVRHG